MQRINVTPMSANKSYKGRKEKTENYKVYEKEVYFLLKGKLEIEKHEKIELIIHAGIGKTSDLDNTIKPFLDILQKRYGFNDKQVYRIIASKEDVKKGGEFISFDFREYREN